MCGNCMHHPVLILCRITKQVGLSTNAFALYLGGAWLGSQLGHQLVQLRIFVVFLSFSRYMPGLVPKLGHSHFLIHYSLIILPLNAIVKSH
jgi:hypothetical protein